MSRSQQPPSPAASAPHEGGIALMTATVLPIWSRQLRAIQNTVQGGAVDLLSCFASIMGLQDLLENEVKALPADAEHTLALQQLSQELALQCERALVGLQFGDRASQMLDILHDDTLRFSIELPNMTQADAAQAKAWLDTLEARYTTDEQRDSHHGESTGPPQDNVEFF